MSVLKPAEAGCVDRTRLDELYCDREEALADRMIGRALDRLATQLGKAERAMDIGDMIEAGKRARRVRAIAGQIGLVRLERAADNLCDSLRKDGNDVARAATLARLLRLWEYSLMEIWSDQNLSI